MISNGGTDSNTPLSTNLPMFVGFWVGTFRIQFKALISYTCFQSCQQQALLLIPRLKPSSYDL